MNNHNAREDTETMDNEHVITREEALGKLEEFGITGSQVYLIDIIPLIEMIWADGHAQDSEIVILEMYLNSHVAHINEIAGYEAITMDAAMEFVRRFTESRPNPNVMAALRSLVTPLRLSTVDCERNQKLREALLAVCLDIGASAVTHYPYGVRERFNPAEKRCFFEILESL